GSPAGSGPQGAHKVRGFFPWTCGNLLLHMRQKFVVTGSWFGSAIVKSRKLSMNRPLTPSLSPSEGERVPGGRVRGWFMVPMHAKNERGLSMNRPSPGLRPPSPALRGEGRERG